MLQWTRECRSVSEIPISVPLDPRPEVRFLVQMAPVLFLEVGWNHWLNGHESEQTPGDSGQGSLVRCSPWGLKESDTTEPLNSNNTILYTQILAAKEKTFTRQEATFAGDRHIYGIGCAVMASQVCLQPLQVVYIKYLQVLIGQSSFNKETFLKVTRFIQTLHKGRNSP